MDHLPHHLPPLPKEYLEAIGRVAISWNYLDFNVNIFLIYLLGARIEDDKSHIPFAHTTFPQKLDIMGALVEQVENDAPFIGFRDYKTVVQPLIKTAQAGRNMVIHSQWMIKDGSVYRASISARQSLKLTHVPCLLSEIVGVHDSIVTAYEALAKLLKPSISEQPQSGQ